MPIEQSGSSTNYNGPNINDDYSEMNQSFRLSYQLNHKIWLQQSFGYNNRFNRCHTIVVIAVWSLQSIDGARHKFQIREWGPLSSSSSGVDHFKIVMNRAK